MTKTKRLVSLTLALVTLLSVMSIFTISTSAIGTGKWNLYNAKSTTVFTVTANKDTSIKFVSLEGGQGVAPVLYLKVYDRNTKNTDYYWVTGWCKKKITSSLSLTEGHTYDITVCYNYNASRNLVDSLERDKDGNPKKVWADGTWYVANNNNCSFE